MFADGSQARGGNRLTLAKGLGGAAGGWSAVVIAPETSKAIRVLAATEVRLRCVYTGDVNTLLWDHVLPGMGPMRDFVLPAGTRLEARREAEWGSDGFLIWWED